MGEEKKAAGVDTKRPEREGLKTVAHRVQEEFDRERRVLSFDEYLRQFEESPLEHCRDAAGYLSATIDYYGSDEIENPTGKSTRYRLFDQGFLEDRGNTSMPLVGQEKAQESIVRCLNNFKREGAPNRVLLMHGPNGSSKSTIAACLMSGLEDYSRSDAGALYRFHWVFPRKSFTGGAIGFSGGAEHQSVDGSSSFAHLSDEQLETKLQIEVRDHPLFLFPPQERRRYLKNLIGLAPSLPRWVEEGVLCDKNQKIFTALLSSYRGSLEKVLRHIQIERYFLSRRYRCGAVTLGPELSVDASERQITADHNPNALPASLQGLSLYDVRGELLDASGGLLELSDLLKRPIDAYKYLQTTIETGEISMGSQILGLNCVMLASGNELHLRAFREHPEYDSFRGRFELIPVPYLRNHLREQEIYDEQVASQLVGYVAPHATEVAARFAALTRLTKPKAERYPEDLRAIVSQVNVWQKLQAYAGELTEIFVEKRRVSLGLATVLMFDENEGMQEYEGSLGVSPRLMRTVLMDAVQHADFDYLSPFAVLEELDALCDRVTDHSFLRLEPTAGGFHDHSGFRASIRTWLLDTIEDEFRVASGLVDESSYEEVLKRYILHVSAWVKHEKISNTLTGELDDPDEKLMQHAESLLYPPDEKEDVRSALLSHIAAWAIDHPGKTLEKSNFFLDRLSTIRSAVFKERRDLLEEFCGKVAELSVHEQADEDEGLSKGLGVLREQFGYQRQAAMDGAARLLSMRFSPAR